ncbi:divergent polysaccharide deacetylase family protein, partial [Pararhodobacter aggregans]|uniref:divergent polysaccharide deacetylase family protein n=1 Tax=Pararhodobacter aggregans TaxID=404875 RepID=UPI003A939A02
LFLVSQLPGGGAAPAAPPRLAPVPPAPPPALPAGEPLLTEPDAGAVEPEADTAIAAPEADETTAAPENGAQPTPTRRLPPVAQDETLALVPPVPEPSAPQEPAAPGLPAPVIAPALPRGEPLLPGAAPERPPVSTLPGQVAGVIVGRGTLGDVSTVRRGGVQMAGRLPTIGDTADEAPADATTAAPDTRPAVERFAAQPALGADQVPLGVVLIDEPAAETAILALPVPVTVALDPYDPEAPRRAAAYRAVGHEIALQAMRVPQLATPSDLETLIDGWQRAFPEAMAVIDVPVNGLGANPALARNVAAMLATEGYGAIALRDGLDAFLQASRGAGLRAASVYRVIESDDQSEFTIRRLIDRAAFEALRQPAVVIAAAASDRDTMRELTDFAEGAGRAGVGLAPVSAVLNRN